MDSRVRDINHRFINLRRESSERGGAQSGLRFCPPEYEYLGLGSSPRSLLNARRDIVLALCSYLCLRIPLSSDLSMFLLNLLLPRRLCSVYRTASGAGVDVEKKFLCARITSARTDEFSTDLIFDRVARTTVRFGSLEPEPRRAEGIGAEKPEHPRDSARTKVYRKIKE